MFRLWAKAFKNNKMLWDMIVCNDDSTMTRTKKVFAALDEVCYNNDLSKPIWLDATVADFRKYAKARFTKDNFIDTIEFDFLEIQIIEED